MNVKPYIIGIAGASCSGKTTISRELERILTPEQSVIFPMDNYYRNLTDLEAMAIQSNWLLKHPDPLQPVGITDINFDMPDALDTELIFQHFATLASGEGFDCPVYKFDCHSRADYTERVEPKPFVIVEGLFTLYWKQVRNLCKTKVFIDVTEAAYITRRLDRDVRERGRTEAAINEQYKMTVKPMFEKYGKKSRRFANVIVDGEAPIAGSTEAVIAHIAETMKTPGLKLLLKNAG